MSGPASESPGFVEGLIHTMLGQPTVRPEVVVRMWAQLAARRLPPPAPVLASRMIDTMVAERLARASGS